MKKNRNKKKQQLKLLNCGNASELSKFKKRTKMSKAGKITGQSDDSDLFFDNLINVEELAVIFELAPQTIRNWVALGKIPHVKIGRKWFFQKRSLQEWLNQKKEPQWR